MRTWPLVMLLVTAPLLAAEPLVDFSIFKSFYRSDVTVRWEARVPLAQLAPYRLVAALNPADQRAEGTLQRQSVPRLLRAQGSLSFDTTRLSGGRYAIDVELREGDGPAIQRETLYFPILRDASVKSRLVTVRPSDNMLIVRSSAGAPGEPFFPIGIYESPGTETYMKKLAAAGFNLCHVPGGASPMLPKLLDTALAHGMRAWISASSLLDFSTDADKRRGQLTEMVRLVGNHPGLLCWESIDEPAWGKQSAEGLYEGYCFLRALDQQHLIWTNHAPRNTIAELAHFNRATDAAGCDIYPLPDSIGHSDLPDKTLSVVGAETDKSFATVNQEKPIFMVLQGFGWGELSAADPKHPPVMPTFAQSRFMAYDAIVHGANGLLYWGTHYTKKPARFWSELRSLTSELAALQSVLASETVRGKTAAVASKTPGLRLVHKRTGGFNYLLLVNEKPDPIKVALAVPGMKAKSLRRLFERGDYAIKNGRLSIGLGGYDVAVLSDNLKFAGKRQDYTAEWLNAPLLPPLALTEPGNLIRNSGFEVDQEEDAMPDEWVPSVALTALLSPDAHSGKHSLMLQGTGGDLAPLAVQRAVDVQANQKYRFSAWVKTVGEGVEVRFYSEWVTDTFHAHCLPWTKGTGEWQKLEYEFEGVPDPKGGAYAVVQVKGEGAAYFDDLKLELVE